MVVPFVMLLLVLVLISWFIATAIRKKKRGEDMGERESSM